MSSLPARLQNFLLLASRRSDLVLGVMLMAAVFMLVLPMPTWLIDVLLAINIAVSTVLLMLALYLPSPLAFTAFPSVLLVTTLFRLALSVATTRLILLDGDAGHIIEAFGNFVVAGNLVVGLVVFSILTVVQFIVITKGAERVAEVVARFSLDGLPGKQMSIDADLRGGIIDGNEARNRRALLQKETQMYGAMDGAVKFVKGDAIASIVIVLVNLIAGISIGVFQHGMPASAAAALYSVLTIGDGLVAQIPALLISITAGLIVTRVTGDQNATGVTNLGQDVVGQMLSYPSALMLGALIMLIFAIVPGMPTTTFLVLAVVIAALGLRGLMPRRGGKDSTIAPAQEAKRAAPADVPSSASGGTQFSLPHPLILEIAQDFEHRLNPAELMAALRQLRQDLYLELGLPLPAVHVRYSRDLPDGHYSILVHEILAASGQARPGAVMVMESPRHLQALEIEFDEAPASLVPGMPTLWVDAALVPRLNEMGIRPLLERDILCSHLRTLLKRHARQFIGIQEVSFLLSQIKKDFPELVVELERVVSPQKVADVLQRLVNEGVSIRNLRVIAESLVEWGGRERDEVLLTEYVRMALKRQLSHTLSGAQRILPAYLFTPEVEDEVRNGIRRTSVGSYLSIEPAVSETILETIKRHVGDIALLDPKPVLLTSPDIRRYVRTLVEEDLYDLAVLSFQELYKEVSVQPIGRIAMT